MIRPDTRNLVARLADTMVERVAASGSCTEADLACAGFTGAEIAAHADRARQIAVALDHGTLRRPASIRGPRRVAALPRITGGWRFDPDEPALAARARGW